jgi:hypothetical protein
MCVLIFSTIFVSNIAHSYNEFNEILSQMYIGLHVNCPLFLPEFNQIWIFSRDFQNILKHQTPSKSVQWEMSSSMSADGRTHRQTLIAKLMVAFWTSETPPEMSVYVTITYSYMYTTFLYFCQSCVFKIRFRNLVLRIGGKMILELSIKYSQKNRSHGPYVHHISHMD